MKQERREKAMKQIKTIEQAHAAIRKINDTLRVNDWHRNYHGLVVQRDAIQAAIDQVALATQWQEKIDALQARGDVVLARQGQEDLDQWRNVRMTPLARRFAGI
jgi:hypothetical protein